MYTRVFLREEFGVVTEVYAYVAFLIVIFMYGMETTLFRFSEKRDELKGNGADIAFSTVSISVIVSSLLLGAFLLLGDNFFAELLRYPDHPEYIQWFTAILFCDAISSIAFARLRLQDRAIKFATLKLVNIGVNIGLNLFLIVACPYLVKSAGDSFLHQFAATVWSAEIGVGYIFISNLMASVATLALIFPEFFKVKWVFKTALWKDMMRYTWPLAIAALAYVVNENLDKTLLKFLLPGSTDENLAQLGVYGACYKLSIMMTLFVQAFRYAVEPFFFKEFKTEGAEQSYAKVMTVFVAFGCLIFTGIMVFLDLVKYFIGPEFHEGLAIVPILLLANLLLGVYFNLSAWYKLTDKTIYGAYFSIAGAFVTVILNISLIPVLGYLGSAWATLCCYLVMCGLSYTAGRKHYFIPYEFRKLTILLTVALALWFGFELISKSTGLSESYWQFVLSSLVIITQAGISWKVIGLPSLK